MPGLKIRYAVLAYGAGDAVYAQAAMALVSLLAYAPEPCELVALTDHPERFDWLKEDVDVRPVAAEQLGAWIGPHSVSMRQKIEAARAALPADGALVMLDADTLAVADLSPMVAALAAGYLLMHTREFVLAESARAGNRKLWQQLEGRRFAGFQFDSTDAMWNSGVLGVAPTEAPLLDDALHLYDAMVAAGVRHFALEQLAVGAVLQRTGRLQPAEPWFTHYWGNKQGFAEEIERRLSRGGSPRTLAAELRDRPVDLPAEVRPSKWTKLRRWFTAARRP